MMWALPLAGMALGALRGNSQAKRQQAIEDDSRKQLAAQQKYSPWTGRTNFSQIQYAGSTPFDAALGGGLQGGIAGASLSQGIEGATSASASPMSPSGSSYLGGSKLAAGLGNSAPVATNAAAQTAAQSPSYLGMSGEFGQESPYLQQQQAPSLYKNSPWSMMSSRGGYSR